MATQKPAAAKKNEIHIKEDAESEDYFRHHVDTTVLPPEHHITIRDGFRFGIGFILASLIFYVVAVIGVLVVIKVAPLLHLT